VILVIGIFGIIRVFPTGFGIINYGEHVSAASKLANAALEQARSNAQNLPDAIIPIHVVGTGQNAIVEADPSLTPAIEADDFEKPMPSDPVQAAFFGFNRTRRIIGETTKVPAPSTDVPYMPLDPDAPQGSTRRQLVSVYTLQYGPIDTQVALPLVYSGQPLDRVAATHEYTESEATDLGVFRYAVLYLRDRIVLFMTPAAYDRTFKVQYSYTVPDPAGPFHAQSLPDTRVVVPANTFRREIPLPNGGVPEEGEEIVSRAFSLITNPNEPFSPQDPFQFRLLNTFAGIIGINPLASLVRQSDSNRALTVKVDYDVADWHIVSEEVTVPQEAPFRVKLTLNFLKQANVTVNDNNEPFTGITPSLPGIDLVVLDLDRGITMDSRSLTAGVANANGVIDYRSGTITFNPRVRWSMPPAGAPGPDESIAGQHLRIYYRTEDEFGLQVQKAFTNYLRSANRYTITPGQYGQEQFGYLLFPASDNNQSVLVDYSFTETDPVTGEQRTQRVAGEMQLVRDPTPGVWFDSPQAVISGVPPGLWFVRLQNVPKFGSADPNGRANILPVSIKVLSVRGVSMRSRTLWREGTRWRHLDTTTYLSRPGA
jgi:hypothetical protein